MPADPLLLADAVTRILSRPHRWPILALCAASLVVAGCSSTSRLYVHNDTPNPYALRIDRSDDAYALQPASKVHIEKPLQRDRAYQLTVREKGGKQHTCSLFTHAPNHFVRLHLSQAGELQWDLTTSPSPEPASTN